MLTGNVLRLTLPLIGMFGLMLLWSLTYSSGWILTLRDSGERNIGLESVRGSIYLVSIRYETGRRPSDSTFYSSPFLLPFEARNRLSRSVLPIRVMGAEYPPEADTRILSNSAIGVDYWFLILLLLVAGVISFRRIWRGRHRPRGFPIEAARERRT